MDRNLKDLGLFIQCLQPRELKPSTCFSDSTRSALHLEKTRFKLSQFPRTSRKYAAAFSVSVLWSSLHGYLAKKSGLQVNRWIAAQISPKTFTLPSHCPLKQQRQKRK